MRCYREAFVRGTLASLSARLLDDAGIFEVVVLINQRSWTIFLQS